MTAWWDEVLAGNTDLPHPVYGDGIKVRFSGGRLILAGELDSRRDRDEILREAHARVGSGMHEIDASGLRYRTRPEKRGILDQTLIAAYPHRDLTELARKFILERSRIRPKHVEIVERQPARLRQLVPGFVGDAQRRLDRGETLLVIRVDEVDAFNVRALLEEETRSTWTVASPPELAHAEGV